MIFKEGDLVWLSYRRGQEYGLLRITGRKMEGWNAREYLDPPVYYVVVVKNGERGEATSDILVELNALERMAML